MTDWRTPDTLLISRKPKPELGQLAIEILGPHHQDLARTPWRQRPVLAAIGLRRLANRSIDITDLCQAMGSKPEDALFALKLLPGNALWKFIELLDAQNLYWGDISRIDTLISGSSMPPWARGMHQLDALIAKLIYDDADKTAAWSRLFKDGLSVDDTAMLYAWRKLEITSHGILRGPNRPRMRRALPERPAHDPDTARKSPRSPCLAFISPTAQPSVHPIAQHPTAQPAIVTSWSRSSRRVHSSHHRHSEAAINKQLCPALRPAHSISPAVTARP